MQWIALICAPGLLIADCAAASATAVAAAAAAAAAGVPANSTSVYTCVIS